MHFEYFMLERTMTNLRTMYMFSKGIEVVYKTSIQYVQHGIHFDIYILSYIKDVSIFQKFAETYKTHNLF